MSEQMNLTLKVWRQKNKNEKGRFVTYQAKEISEDMSFLEMLDVVNEENTKKGEDPIYFDHDCREGICGMCSLVINGRPHGPEYGTTTCQLHMRHFHDGQTIVIEPWRAAAFPVLKDLAVDRTAFERIQQARSEEHTSELQSRGHLVCRLLLEKKKTANKKSLYK